VVTPETVCRIIYAASIACLILAAVLAWQGWRAMDPGPCHHDDPGPAEQPERERVDLDPVEQAKWRHLVADLEEQQEADHGH
jgi:hypothetical protein